MPTLQAKLFKVTDQVISPVGRLLFKIKHEFLCKSTNILYYTTWTICGKDYVGQTKDFHKRMNNHKSDIRGTPNKETLSIDKHIHYCELEKYQTFVDPFFHVIPFLYIKEQGRRGTLEKCYIKKFDTVLNEKDTLQVVRLDVKGNKPVARTFLKFTEHLNNPRNILEHH